MISEMRTGYKLTYVVHDGRDGGGVHGSLRLKGFNVIERSRVKQLCEIRDDRSAGEFLHLHSK